MKEIASKKMSLNQTDWHKIGKGAIMAASGALLTYATELVANINWGDWAPVVVAVSSVLINAGWKYIRGQ